ncbi:MAG TPA: WYL domain-containing protein, partial [Rikenellaceae bacterium]|nr:WYL domain-containing protein [Rikenellaceae bacterium]
MAVNYFKRYIWLIDLIARRGYISFKEISEAWSKSPLNETGSPLSERTFF